MSIASENRVRALEQRIAALEAAFSRPRPAEEHSLADVSLKVQKLAGEIMAMKARMGKKID